MSDCPKCWDTLCACGWEYRDWSSERREGLAASALGVGVADLRAAVKTPEKYPMLFDEDWRNSRASDAVSCVPMRDISLETRVRVFSAGWEHADQFLMSVKHRGGDVRHNVLQEMDRVGVPTQLPVLPEARSLPLNSSTNVEHVHPLPAWAEDELGEKVHITEDAANTAAGSGLHDAACSAFGLIMG